MVKHIILNSRQWGKNSFKVGLNSSKCRRSRTREKCPMVSISKVANHNKKEHRQRYTLESLFLGKEQASFGHVVATSLPDLESAHTRAASAVCFDRMQQIVLVICLALSSFGFSACQRPVVSECSALTTCAESL